MRSRSAPALPRQNHTNQAGRHAEVTSNRAQPQGRRHRAYGRDIAIGQLRRRIAASPFGAHVPDVCGLRGQKEMVRTNACGSVAFVADHHVFRDWPAVHLCGNAMGVHPPLGATFPNQPISVQPNMADPYPALANFGAMSRDRAVLVNLWPKAIRQRNADVIRVLVMAQKIASLVARKPSDFQGRATTAGTEGNGRLSLHRKPTPFGATPPAVCAVRGLRATPLFYREWCRHEALN